MERKPDLLQQWLLSSHYSRGTDHLSFPLWQEGHGCRGYHRLKGRLWLDHQVISVFWSLWISASISMGVTTCFCISDIWCGPEDVRWKYWPSETDTCDTNRWDVLAVKAGFLLGGRGDGRVTGGVTWWAGLLGQSLGKVTGHASAVWPARATARQTVRRRTRTLCSYKHRQVTHCMWLLVRCSHFQTCYDTYS